MEREAWLREMRSKAEALYDLISPEYWVTFGVYDNQTHFNFLKKFLERISPNSRVLSAGCGAGRYDGTLLEAGHSVVGIDQSEGMLLRAQEKFPQVHYAKIGIQEIEFTEEFDGIVCIDVLEHIPPEDYPIILHKFQQALKRGGRLYLTVEKADSGEVQEAYEEAKAKGLPVVFGEVVEDVDVTLDLIKEQAEGTIPGEIADKAVYHFYPSRAQVRQWINQAALVIDEEGTGSGYRHFLVKKAE